MKMFLDEISIWICRWSKAQGGQAFSNSSSARQYVLSRFSHVWLFAMLWTVAHQFPLSMGFYKQEQWSGLLCALLGDLPHPGIETMHWQAGSLPLTLPVKPTRRQREKANSLFLFWSCNIHLILPSDVKTPVSRATGLWHLHQWPLGSQARSYTIVSLGSQTFQLSMNYATGFAGLLACRWHAVAYLSLYDCISQFP